MKTAALRTLSLTLVFTVVTGLWLRQRVATAATAGGAVTAGEFLVDPPTLQRAVDRTNAERLIPWLARAQ